jgi:hypothetical protein
MSIASIESRRLQNVGSEESDEYLFLTGTISRAPFAIAY